VTGLPPAVPLVAILGDSRSFDTYYANADYPATALYGYDRTFPHRLRGAALSQPSPAYDVVHVPDHFRGGGVENNCIRLALTDPAACVLLDGIWETLVNKRHFLEWVESELRRHQSRNGGDLDLSYTSSRLAELFVAGALSVSPARYAMRQRHLVSYFRRRRRLVVWMSLPMPPAEHLGGLHYAGNYQCIPEWSACLAAVNDAMLPVAQRFGARWLDLHALMQANGGAGACLIDQWHFSKAFHAAVANELHRLLERDLPSQVPSNDHISRSFMLARRPGGVPLTLVADAATAEAWTADHPEAVVAGVTTLEDAEIATPIAVLFADTAAREDFAATLLPRLKPDSILLYPEELEPIRNPVGNDRMEFAARDIRA
jgi:hypothetical protein